MLEKIFLKTNAYKVATTVIITLTLASVYNLYAIHDLLQHPDLQLLDGKHFLVGSTTIFIFVSLCCVLFLQNNLLRNSIVANDDACRKSLEEQTRFSHIANNTTDMIHLNNSQGEIIYANPATEKLLGYDLSEVINRPAFDLIHPDYIDQIQRDMHRASQGEEIIPVEILLHKKDGGFLRVEAKGFCVNAGKKIEYIGAIFRDLTWKHQKNKLVTKIEELQNTLDALPDFVTVHDPDFTITQVNKSLCIYLGLDPADIIGKKCYDIFHSTSNPINDCPHNESMNKGKTSSRKLQTEKGDYLLITCFPYFDKKGTPCGSVHVARKIDDFSPLAVERAEKAINANEARIKESLGIISICSHCKDIRNTEGKWGQVEHFMAQHLDLLFSHSICDDCAKRHYPNYFDMQ